MSEYDPKLAIALEKLWREGPPVERDNFFAEISLNLSKLGDLSAFDEVLWALGSFFTPQDAVALYVRLRDESQRFEGEWREAFISYFPASRDVLPPQKTSEEDYDDWLEQQGYPR